MSFQVKISQGLKAVPAADWDACALGVGSGDDDPFNPFVSHAFADVDLGQVGLLKVGNPKGSMSH